MMDCELVGGKLFFGRGVELGWNILVSFLFGLLNWYFDVHFDCRYS